MAIFHNLYAKKGQREISILLSFDISSPVSYYLQELRQTHTFIIPITAERNRSGRIEPESKRWGTTGIFFTFSASNTQYKCLPPSSSIRSAEEHCVIFQLSFYHLLFFFSPHIVSQVSNNNKLFCFCFIVCHFVHNFRVKYVVSSGR